MALQGSVQACDSMWHLRMQEGQQASGKMIRLHKKHPGQAPAMNKYGSITVADFQ